MANKINLTDRLQSVLNNPSLMQYEALAYMRDIYSGEGHFSDPSNPVVQVIECAATMTAAAIERNRINTRRTYARVAQTYEELYPHMSDLDFIDRFALPAPATFGLAVPLDQLRRVMVKDPENEYRKVVIPRYTKFSVVDIEFTLSYPVEIREMPHGGITIVYDASIVNPVQELATNVIEHYITHVDGVDMLSFNLDVLQYTIQTGEVTITPSAQTSYTKEIKDQFFFARVYLKSRATDERWREIRTTHTDQVYDPAELTAVIKVVGQKVTVRIPQIYTQHPDLRTGKIRVDIHQTRGPLHTDLGAYSQDSFGYQWSSLDESGGTVFSAAIERLIFTPYSGSFVNGGRDPLEFSEFRRRVIQNSNGPRFQPISPDQIQTTLVDMDYEIVKNVDNLTNRALLATRLLPPPRHERLISSAALSVQSAVFAIDDIQSHHSVYDNGKSITISPNSIFQDSGGLLRILTKNEIDALLALVPDDRSPIITTGKYFYTPFHYVIDVSDKEMDVRAYYLESPVIHSKAFVMENSTTGFQVSTAGYEIRMLENGYEILVTTSSGESTKKLKESELLAQLSFRPANEKDPVYVMGELVAMTSDKERVYRFFLETNFAINRNHGMELTNFMMYEPIPRRFFTELFQDFHIYYCADYPVSVDWLPNQIDREIATWLLPPHTIGITHEILRVELGIALENLWTRSRNFMGTEAYQRYEQDVPYRYPENVYEIDPDTGSEIWIENGEPVRKLLYKKGDIALDSEGNPIIQYFAGEVMKDYTGAPVSIGMRKVQMQVDFMLVEGVYAFATDPITQSYQRELAQMITSWIDNDLKGIIPELLDKTKIYFYPKTTTGNVDVMFGPGLVTTLNASQSLSVDLHVDDHVHSDARLRMMLQENTIRVINNHFTRTYISISDIIFDLKQVYGNDVIDVRVSGLGGTKNYSVLSLMNETDRLSLRKRLEARPDGILSVVEDIHFEFIRHRLDKNIML